MTNVGNIDRIVRAVAGAVLLAAPFLMAAWPGVWGYVMAAAGLVLIGTAAFRFCPAYRLLGLNTCGLR